MLSIDQFKSKYLKYKKKYINYKNKLLNLYGGRSEYYEVIVEGYDESEIVKRIKDEFLEKFIKRFIFSKEKIIMNQTENTVRTMINSFFINERYPLLLNSIINANIGKLYEDIKKIFGFNIEDIKKDVIAIDGAIQGIETGLTKAKGETPPNEVKIKKLEENMRQKLELKEQLINNYKLSMLIKILFTDFFKTCKDIQDNTHGIKYEEFINTLIKDKFTSLKLPILYLSNINCISDDKSIFPPPPADNKTKYSGMKGEIDGIILIKRGTSWYPIMILEMKNNMELVLDDISSSQKLLDNFKSLDGLKDIKVNDKIYKINLDGFKDIYFLYCINHMNLGEDSNFNFMNFEKIKTITQTDINKIIKDLPNKEKFISSMKLSDYILNTLEEREFRDFSEEQELEQKKKELMDKKESSKEFVLPDPLIDIKIKSIQVEQPLITRPIMNASRKVDFHKIYKNIEEEALKFNEFFHNPTHLILHIHK